MQYNKVERMLAYLLSKFPTLKLKIKKSYQKLNYIKYKLNYSYMSIYKINKISFDIQESYFGYYDKSPINNKNDFILFNRVKESTKDLPLKNSEIEIVLYNIIDNKYMVIDTTSTYNWQQGAKAMWINDYKFIFNSYDRNTKEYISKVYDIYGRYVKTINFPIYDIYQDKYALSLNFNRLNILRPDYGYRNNDISINWKNNKDDGIYYVDLVNNTHKLLISIQDVIEIHKKENMDGAKHKLNHIMISPDGSKFMFLHRWFVGDRKFDSLIVADMNGSNIKCISDDDMVSHCFWYKNDKIFSFLRDKEHGDKYYMIDIETSKKTIIGEGIIDSFGDGHPNIFEDDVIFDTYPNKARMKELYKFNLKTYELEKLGEFFESFDFYGETRCDLHPRFSFNGKKVFIDSVHENERYLYMINLEDKVE